MTGPYRAARRGVAGPGDLFEVQAIGPDIANVRVSQRHQLLAIAGVGEDFLVAGDGGVEDHLTHRGAWGPDRLALPQRAVCQRQDGCGMFPL
jgi:hypothetical protein